MPPISPPRGLGSASRRRRPGRLLLVLPLIVVMGLWFYSLGRYDSRQIILSQIRYRLVILDGSLSFEHHRLAPGENANSATASADTHLIPFWQVWLATAILTIALHYQVRAWGRTA